MTGVGNQEAEAHTERPGVPLPRAVWFVIAATLLLAPVFAHGCHGDDVDHEPLLIPFRLTPDDP